MKELTLIRGLPGSGKSTLAKHLAGCYASGRYFEADMFFIEDGVYKFDASKIKEAHKWCLMQTVDALSSGYTVYVSNPFSQKWEMHPYIELGYPTTIIECQNSFDSIHGVPNEVIERMKKRWE